MKKCISCEIHNGPNSPGEGAVGKCNKCYQRDGKIFRLNLKK